MPPFFQSASLTPSENSTSSGDTDITAVYRGERPDRPRVSRSVRVRYRTPPRKQKLQDEESTPGPSTFDGADEDNFYDAHPAPFPPQTAHNDEERGCLA